MRVGLLAHGTRGDIQPMVALADELTGRGHDVRMTVNTNLCEWASKTGVNVVPTEPDLQRYFDSERGRRNLARGHFFSLLQDLIALEMAAFDSIAAATLEATRNADVIVSTALTVYRAGCVAERRDIPHGILWLAPVATTGAWAPFSLPVRDLGSRVLNRWANEAVHWVYYQQYLPMIRRLRAHLGLPEAVRRPLPDDVPAVTMVSEALVPPPGDWGDDHQVVGFPDFPPHLRRAVGEGIVPDRLETWLTAGPPPVYFGFGSMPVLDPQGLLTSVRHVCRKLGVRGLIGAGWTRFADGDAEDEDLLIMPHFDHDQVMPRLRAAVHHGGAGTTATVLRAGLPAFVVSVFVDQPFWGWRVAEAGAGVTDRFQTLTPERLLRGVERILQDDMMARARDLGKQVRAERALSATADIIERWATSPTWHPAAMMSPPQRHPVASSYGARSASVATTGRPRASSRPSS